VSLFIGVVKRLFDALDLQWSFQQYSQLSIKVSFLTFILLFYIIVDFVTHAHIKHTLGSVHMRACLWCPNMQYCLCR